MSSGVIRVGVAGWDYPDWAGVVYPGRSRAGFDRLAWLAQYVEAIEVNSSFYRPVAPRTAAAWVRRTASAGPDWRFTAKAHRSWTHEPDPDVAQAVATTLNGLQPLHEAGRLGALLVQLPHAFRFTPQALERLERLVELLAGWPVVVEVRHVSWAVEEAAEWFRRRAVGWCAVDQPQVGGTTLGALPRVTAEVGYLRLHGRNAANWFRADAGRDARYDYLYAAEELGGLAGCARSMAGETRELYVIQNNHFRGQAVVNALQLRRLLSGKRPRAPATLVASYPALEPEVDVERDGLF